MSSFRVVGVHNLWPDPGQHPAQRSSVTEVPQGSGVWQAMLDDPVVDAMFSGLILGDEMHLMSPGDQTIDPFDRVNGSGITKQYDPHVILP